MALMRTMAVYQMGNLLLLSSGSGGQHGALSRVASMEGPPAEESWAALVARVGAYHERELRRLVEHLRAALARLESGELDVFEFDALAYQYKKAARDLWKFCSQGGSDMRRAARRIGEIETGVGERIDWWQLAATKPKHKAASE
jgi:hypothetical protein